MKPAGLGWWVAFEGAADAGPKPRDLEVLVARARRTGASWVLPRAGDAVSAPSADPNRVQDGDFSRASCEAYAAAGFGVYPWVFGRPGAGGVARMVAQFARVRDWPGVRGAVINSEFEVEHQSAAEARELVRQIRDLGFEFVAHAPPDYLGGRGTSAYFVALDEACDAILPQVYAYEHDDRGHVHHLEAVRALYEKRRVDLGKVWPVLCSYRPKTRGFDKGPDGKLRPRPTPPMADEARRVAEDVIAGLEHPWSSASPVSIYTLDAVSFINGPADRVIEAIRAGTEKRDMGLPPSRRVDSPAEMQRALVSLGFDLGRSGPAGDGIDGKVGPRTLAALAAYRADRRVTEAETLDRLEAEYSALGRVEVPADPRGSAPADAAEVIDHLFPSTAGKDWSGAT